MNIPDAAIEAAADAMADALDGDGEDWMPYMRFALTAAMPAIREALAQEIEAELHLDGTGEGWDTAIGRAFGIVRGGAE